MRIICEHEDGSSVRIRRHKAGSSEDIGTAHLGRGSQSCIVMSVPSSLKSLAPAVLKVGGSSVRKDTPEA